MKALSVQIHEYLSCPPSKVKEILIDLVRTKDNFAPNLSLNALWEQEKNYYKEHGCNAFDYGYTKSLKHLPS